MNPMSRVFGGILQREKVAFSFFFQWKYESGLWPHEFFNEESVGDDADESFSQSKYVFFTSLTLIELFVSRHWQAKKKRTHTSELSRSNWTFGDRIDRRMSTACHELMVYDAIMTHLQKLHALHNFTCNILLHRWNQWNFVSEMISVLFIRIVLQCETTHKASGKNSDDDLL